MRHGRIIILEGPDGGGKTTLATALRDRMGFEMVHFGVPGEKEDVLLTYAREIQRFRLSGRDVVFDRLHLGEVVYGTLIRNNDRIGNHGLVLMNRLLRACDATIVFCMPPLNVCMDNWRKRHETEYVASPDTLRDIYTYYDGLAHQYSNRRIYPHTLTWDYTLQNGVEFLDRAVLRHIQIGHLPPWVIGSRLSRVLFIGDRANQELDLPFFTKKNCSGFFLDCLGEAEFPEDRISFQNAYTVEGEPNPIQLGAGLGGIKHVVLLGTNAMRAFCQHLGDAKSQVERDVHVHELRHPQFVKRFHWPRRTTYIQQLREVRIAAGI